MHAEERGARDNGVTGAESRPRVPLHTKILLGLAIGAIAGIMANLFAGDAAWVDAIVTYVKTLWTDEQRRSQAEVTAVEYAGG